MARRPLPNGDGAVPGEARLSSLPLDPGGPNLSSSSRRSRLMIVFIVSVRLIAPFSTSFGVALVIGRALR
jgi:hypothetical protein